MANNITVKWLEVTGLVGNGMDGASYKDLFDSRKQKSTLDFGNVQAGKTTAIKCVVANFNGVSQVSDLQFWLDSTTANEQGSTNTNLSTQNGWNFYYCIVPKDRLNFGIEPDSFSEAQKKGETTQDNQMSYLDENNTFYMRPIERSPNVSINQFPLLSDENKPLVINLNNSSAALGDRNNDSHLIMLSVQTPANANSGTTEGWYYRMNFLYN